MVWTLDKSHVSWHRWDALPADAKRNWDTFQDAIHNDGLHPSQAAERVGLVAHRQRADYKCLIGDQFQIRLSYSERATFRVDESTHTVTVLEVGGHT